MEQDCALYFDCGSDQEVVGTCGEKEGCVRRSFVVCAQLHSKLIALITMMLNCKPVYGVRSSFMLRLRYWARGDVKLWSEGRARAALSLEGVITLLFCPHE